jgi:queuosine precursor transporter
MRPMNRRPLAVVAYAAFIATIPLANWTLHRYGFVDVPGLGPVASGVVWVGAAFVLRDLAQLLTNRWLILVAIAVGVGLSVVLADPGLAFASGAAFAVSEMLDWSIYTPLADRRFLVAVALSSFAGALIDSWLFLELAFDSSRGWWQLAVVKSAVIAVFLPLAWGVRRRAVPRYFTG